MIHRAGTLILDHDTSTNRHHWFSLCIVFCQLHEGRKAWGPLHEYTHHLIAHDYVLFVLVLPAPSGFGHGVVSPESGASPRRRLREQLQQRDVEA